MEIVRTPYAVVYQEESAFKDVYGGAGGDDQGTVTVC